MGIDTHSLPSGFAALIGPDGGLIFMSAAGLSVRWLIGEMLSEDCDEATP